MDYKCNTCEALTLALDLHQIVQPGKKKKKKTNSEAGHVNVLCASYLLFKLFLIVGLKEDVNQHLKHYRVTMIDLCSVKRAKLDIILQARYKRARYNLVMGCNGMTWSMLSYYMK